jgi:hypothetical protein
MRKRIQEVTMKEGTRKGVAKKSKGRGWVVGEWQSSVAVVRVGVGELQKRNTWVRLSLVR